MKQWKKSSEALKATFDAALPDDAAVERRQMFGYPCAFVRGNMVTGLHEENLLVRLGDAERAKLLATPGTKTFEPMPGRRMKEYVVVPAAWHADAKTLRVWIGKAVAYGKTLAAKVKKTNVESGTGTGRRNVVKKKRAVARKAASKKKAAAKKKAASKKRGR